jgi:hypothetical protein
MKLSPLQVEAEPLAALIVEASQLLVAGEFRELAEKFGYAIALGREPSAAIQEDLRSSLAHAEDVLDPDSEPKVRVMHLNPSSQNLYAAAECTLATSSGSGVIVELVVSVSGNDFHATIEQISAAA